MSLRTLKSEVLVEQDGGLWDSPVTALVGLVLLLEQDELD